MATNRVQRCSNTTYRHTIDRVIAACESLFGCHMFARIASTSRSPENVKIRYLVFIALREIAGACHPDIARSVIGPKAHHSSVNSAIYVSIPKLKKQGVVWLQDDQVSAFLDRVQHLMETTPDALVFPIPHRSDDPAPPRTEQTKSVPMLTAVDHNINKDRQRLLREIHRLEAERAKDQAIIKRLAAALDDERDARRRAIPAKPKDMSSATLTPAPVAGTLSTRMETTPHAARKKVIAVGSDD